MRCRWRRWTEENTGGRKRRNREMQSRCGENWRKKKTSLNTNTMKEKVKTRQETKLCLCRYFLAIIPPSEQQLKEKTHQAYQVSDRLKQSETRFCVFFHYSFLFFFFFKLWAEHTTWGQHRFTLLSPLWRCDAMFTLHAGLHLHSRRSERSVMNIRKSTLRNQTTEIMTNTEHGHEETITLIL